MKTIANVAKSESSHFYLRDGTPLYEVPYSDPSKGMRKATLADARKVGAYPSVTTILSVLDKPALTAWKIEMAVLAVMTTPRLAGEADDAFIERVLHAEKQQEQEGEKARDLGTDIHQAIADALNGRQCPDELRVYVEPVLEMVKPLGRLVDSEKIVVGNGYAGKLDALFQNDAGITVMDFKSTKKLPPKASWPEHVLQLSSYAAALPPELRFFKVETANIYISTTEPGKVAIFVNPPWDVGFKQFRHCLALWGWLNNYVP
jgi:hypothetical protein